MTLPGLSGSFILILLGNYVLLLVDSVNALYDTMADVISWDFSFMNDPARRRMLQVLAVFSVGSLAGLVSLSHLLGYVLKKRKKETFAVIIGFIAGSLGVVWPWKEKIYKMSSKGNILIDRNGNKIIDNYDRFWPEFDIMSTWLAIFFILVGIFIVLGLAWYENRNQVK